MSRLSYLLVLPLLILTISCSQRSPSHFFKNGSAKYQLKDYDGAILDLNRAIKLNPDYTEAYYFRAICEVKLDELDEALKDFNKVLELDPNYKDAYFNRAYYIKDKRGDYKGSIEDYNKFISLNKGGNNAFALNNRGFAKYKLNFLEDALGDVEKSLSIDPANAYAYRNRAKIFIAMDSLDAACSDLKKAIDYGYPEKYGKEVDSLLEQYCGDQSGT